METTSAIAAPLLLGGFLGLIGQSIRVIVGLKKTYDTVQQQSRQFSDSFNGKQLLVSLLIGFISGCLATLVQLDFKANPALSWTQALAVETIAVGYAGADFIEGFMKKYLPADNAGNNTVSNNNTAANNAMATTTGLSTADIIG